jgi:hypothetical protein
VAGYTSQEEIHLKIQQLQESVKVCQGQSSDRLDEKEMILILQA